MATALPDGLVLPILIMAVIILALLWNDRISKSSGSKSRKSGGSNGGGSGTKEREPDGPKITKLELYPRSVNPGDEMVIRGEYETNAGVSEFNLTYDDQEVSVDNIGGGNFSSEKIEAKQGEHNGSAYIKDENRRSHSLSTSFYVNNQGKTLEPPTIEVHPKIQDDRIIVTVEGIPTTADSISETTIKVDGVGKQEEPSNKAELIFDRKPGNYRYTATTTDSNNQEAEQKGSFPVTERVGETEEGTESQRIYNFIEQNIKPVISKLQGSNPELAKSFEEVIEQLEEILAEIQNIELDSQEKKKTIKNIEDQVEDISSALLSKINEATYNTILNPGDISAQLKSIANQLREINSAIKTDIEDEDLSNISSTLNEILAEIKSIEFETEGDAVNELNIGDLPDEVQEALSNFNEISGALEDMAGGSLNSNSLTGLFVDAAEILKESDNPNQGEKRVAAAAQSSELVYLLSQMRGQNQRMDWLAQQNNQMISRLIDVEQGSGTDKEMMAVMGEIIDERLAELSQELRRIDSAEGSGKEIEVSLQGREIDLSQVTDRLARLEGTVDQLKNQKGDLDGVEEKLNDIETAVRDLQVNDQIFQNLVDEIQDLKKQGISVELEMSDPLLIKLAEDIQRSSNPRQERKSIIDEIGRHDRLNRNLLISILDKRGLAWQGNKNQEEDNDDMPKTEDIEGIHHELDQDIEHEIEHLKDEYENMEKLIENEGEIENLEKRMDHEIEELIEHLKRARQVEHHLVELFNGSANFEEQDFADELNHNVHQLHAQITEAKSLMSDFMSDFASMKSKLEERRSVFQSVGKVEEQLEQQEEQLERTEQMMENAIEALQDPNVKSEDYT